MSGPSSLTSAIISLSPGVSTPIAAQHPLRQYLGWMNIGVNPMTVVVGSGPAVVGEGRNYGGASSTDDQGGADVFEGDFIPSDAFTAISTDGTTIVVWER